MKEYNLSTMNFEFKELTFDGLRFRKFRKYPWNSKKEGEAYFDKLVEEGTHSSRIKYQDLMKEQFDEAIHIKLSWNLIFKMASISLLIMAVLVGFNGIFIPGMVLLALGTASEAFSKLMERHAHEEFMAKEQSPEMVNLVFEDIK